MLLLQGAREGECAEAEKAGAAVTTWAIYAAPSGAPAPFLVCAWLAAPGQQARHSPPVYAASLEQAREVVPKGLTRSEPVHHESEALNLIETWRAAE